MDGRLEVEYKPVRDPANFDLLDPDVREDPYPWYHELRERAPVHYSEQDDLYVVSRYDDVVSVLRRPEVFSSELGMGALMRGEISPRLRRERTSEIDIAALRVLIATDPPDHTLLRRVVSRPFTPRAIADLEPRIREIAATCVDDLLAADEGGRADFVAHLSAPLPVLVIAEMLGIPADRRDDFKRWSDDVVGALGGTSDLTAGQASMLEMFEFFTTAAEERRKSPGDDLISVLVRGSEDGRLEPMEIVVFSVLLLIAGNETTTNLLGNTLAAFWAHPDADAAVRRAPELLAGVVEESLRYDAPVQALFRQTRQVAEVAGVLLPSGARVLVLFGAANRDPRFFLEPDSFDANRQRNEHIGFGAGIHLCLGAALARLEARVALSELFDRTIAVTPRLPGRRIESFILRGYASLPVEVQTP